MGLGMMEILLIAVVALVVIGPSKLPDIAKSLGKGYGEFKRSFGDFKQAVNLDDLDKPSSGKPSSSLAGEARREEIIDTYRSQWEQKLPASPVQESKATASDDTAQTASAPKKDDGESSGR